MLLVRRNNDSNWLNNWFDDTLFDVDLMPQTKATAPARSHEYDLITHIQTLGCMRNHNDCLVLCL